VAFQTLCIYINNDFDSAILILINDFACSILQHNTVMEAANQDQSIAPWETGDGPSKADFKGDFRNGFIDFGWDKQSDAWKRNKRTVELNQGRAAQMGILGLMTHDLMGNVDTLLPPHF